MPRPLVPGAAILLLALATPARAVLVDIDPAQSSIDVELCVQGSCDTDSSPVDGSVDISLDDYATPTAITLHDFDMLLTQDLAFSLGGFNGRLNVNARGIVASYAMPGTPQGPVPLAGTAFTFTDVPTDLQGTLDYNATGLYCVAMSAAGLPCTDTIDLAALGTVPATISGDVSVSAGTITLTFAPNIAVPLDPMNPGLGMVTLSGSVTGIGTAPACAATPLVIPALRVRRGAPGVMLSWTMEPTAVAGYRVYSVIDPTQAVSGSNPAAVLECSTLASNLIACTDDDALTVGEPLLFYKVLGVCDDGSEGP